MQSATRTTTIRRLTEHVKNYVYITLCSQIVIVLKYNTRRQQRAACVQAKYQHQKLQVKEHTTSFFFSTNKSEWAKQLRELRTWISHGEIDLTSIGAVALECIVTPIHRLVEATRGTEEEPHPDGSDSVMEMDTTLRVTFQTANTLPSHK